MFDPTTIDVPSSLTSSYAIGPIDPTHLTTLQAYLSNGLDISLLVPAHLLPILLSDAEFKDGYEYGYFGGDAEEEWTVAQVVNHIYVNLYKELVGVRSPNVYNWVVGLLLGSLADLAERKRTLALVGMAHLCFLLACVPLDAWLSDNSQRLVQQMDALHHSALRAYRARVRLSREQGMSFSEAQLFALARGTQAC